MIIPGLKTSHRLFTMSNRLEDKHLKFYNDCPMTISFKPAIATRYFNTSADPNLPCRPYIEMLGRVTELHGDITDDKGNVVSDITGFKFDEGDGISATIVYYMSDEEIKAAVDKGLFTANFDCDDAFYNSEIQLQSSCDVALIPTDGIPIAFVDIPNSHLLTMDASDGYNVSALFSSPDAEKTDDFTLDFDDNIFDDYDVDYYESEALFDEEPEIDEVKTIEPEVTAEPDEMEVIYDTQVEPKIIERIEASEDAASLDQPDEIPVIDDVSEVIEVEPESKEIDERFLEDEGKQESFIDFSSF